MSSARSFLAATVTGSLSLLSVSNLVSPVQAASWPDELFSPLIPSKVLAAANNVPANLSVMPYESYTSTGGDWGYRTVDWWTGGFFPATLFAVNTRASLCEPTEENGLGQADWVELGRYLLNPIAKLSTGNSVQHDQGFMSLGLQTDNQVYAFNISGS
jgi:hypothetical protein